ncbi:hypothetical protein GGE07_001408 [Sinorhizobium terangae]|uniref:Restriction endonuclease n=1 Tax=Sinorhizobium terangae TaxID=110322 RepID=A0A6N7LI46_SINTE|nr:hypothetical protein [Sinorhizobium terangae]MBB4184782.1 hypothetical protein [Sinorhizobium terangae]MQX17462.1 hypothetical protein [Sinorhizobium terangae]
MPTTTKVLAQALGSWLQYEYALGRGGLFNERYISTPISQVLSYRFKCGVSAEHPHPTLGPVRGGRGAKPSVDFAVIEHYPKVRALVESKWLNDAGVKVEAIIWDLIRLEMVAHAENAEAYFVLAGKRDRMTEVFEAARYQWQNARLVEGLLFDRVDRASVAVEKLTGKYLQKLRPYFEKYATGSFPSDIFLKQPYSYPYSVTAAVSDTDAGQPKYQVWVWEIERNEGGRRFQPCDAFSLSSNEAHCVGDMRRFLAA